MKRDRSVTLSAAVAGLLLGAPLCAQHAGATNPQAKPAQAAPETAAEGAANTLRKTSELVGATILDGDGKNVGRIEDIAVDSQDGRVQFAAVSVGAYVNPADKSGTDKLVALPLELVKPEGDHLVLTGASRAQVATASLFTPQSWPDPENREWIAMAWKHFGRTPDWPATPDVHLPTKRDGHGLVDPPPPPPPPRTGPAWTYSRVSALLHTTVRNRTGDEFGKADNLIVDLGRDRLSFVVVTPASSLDIADELVAVPWTGMSHGGERMVVDLDKERFTEAPSFNKELWPDLSDANWQAEVNRFFPAQPVPTASGG